MTYYRLEDILHEYVELWNRIKCTPSRHELQGVFEALVYKAHVFIRQSECGAPNQHVILSMISSVKQYLTVSMELGLTSDHWTVVERRQIQAAVDAWESRDDS